MAGMPARRSRSAGSSPTMSFSSAGMTPAGSEAVSGQNLGPSDGDVSHAAGQRWNDRSRDVQHGVRAGLTISIGGELDLDWIAG